MKRAAKGFTLVEVIVALAIFSLIMLGVISALRTFGNTSSSLARMTERTDELRSVSIFLRDALENSVVGTRSGGGGGLSFGGLEGAKPVAYFEVTKGALAWRSTILFGEAYGGSYFLRLIKKGKQLSLQWQEPLDNRTPENWQKSPQRVVLADVELFEVWTRPAPTEEWHRADVGTDEKPSHVKLVIKAGGRYWPEMIMTVQQ